MDHSGDISATIGAAIFVGVALLGAAHRLHIPAIVLLLLGGIALGPHGVGLIQPDALGEGLDVIVSLAVGIVLFEGGLTLDPDGFRQAPRVIWRLLSVGVLVTWLGTSLLVHVILELDLTLALLAGSLVIVTGPTVISPLLRRLRVNSRLHHVLHWEAVMVDPVGVFVAVLMFEWVTASSDALHPVAAFFLRSALGAGAGFAVGFALDRALRRSWIPDELVNLGIFGAVVALFQTCNALLSESGLLAVTVAGLVLGVRQPPGLKLLRSFKLQLTELCIAVLFMLLAANLDLEQFREFGLPGLLLVALVVLLVRPLNVGLSTLGTGLDLRERVFLSWVAPRGIVAASMSSLFALHLGELGYVEAPLLEAFTYAVIAATVMLQAPSAGWVASLLGVRRAPRRDWVLVGAHPFARRVARYLERASGGHVVLLDMNPDMVAAARAEGVRAELGDATGTELLEKAELGDVGHLLVLTDNPALNALVARRWAEELGAQQVHRWDPGELAAHGPELGRPVWGELARPSSISHDLLSGAAHLAEVTLAEARALPDATLLAVASRSQVRLGHELDAFGADALALVLATEPPLVGLFRRELLFELYEPPKDAEAAFLFAAERLAEHLGLEPEPIFADFKRRRRTFDTAIGHAVALPHAYHPALSEPVAVFVRIPAGLELLGPDGEPVRVVVLLVSPPNDPDQHLIALGEIARRLRSPVAVKELLEAPFPEGLYQLLRRPEEAA